MQLRVFPPLGHGEDADGIGSEQEFGRQVHGLPRRSLDLIVLLVVLPEESLQPMNVIITVDKLGGGDQIQV